jgi:hypothetical protein
MRASLQAILSVQLVNISGGKPAVRAMSSLPMGAAGSRMASPIELTPSTNRRSSRKPPFVCTYSLFEDL